MWLSPPSRKHQLVAAAKLIRARRAPHVQVGEHVLAGLNSYGCTHSCSALPLSCSLLAPALVSHSWAKHSAERILFFTAQLHTIFPPACSPQARVFYGSPLQAASPASNHALSSTSSSSAFQASSVGIANTISRRSSTAGLMPAASR